MLMEPRKTWSYRQKKKKERKRSRRVTPVSDPCVLSISQSLRAQSYSRNVYKYWSRIFCKGGSESAIQPLPWSICPVTVPANVFISQSFWEIPLSCPYYFPSRPTVFNLALDPWLHHLLQTFHVVCLWGLPKSPTLVLSFPKEPMWLYAVSGLPCLSSLPELSDLFRHQNSSFAVSSLLTGLFRACSRFLPMLPSLQGTGLVLGPRRSWFM